jgi:membrane protein implicated in regulation of membrane protease activity
MAGKLSTLWIVNVMSFLLFSMLGVTGLMNWLLLPRGYGSGAGILVSLRHFLVTLHEWTGLLFMIVIGIHIFLHWAYVKKNLDRDREKSNLAGRNIVTHQKQIGGEG